MIASATAAPAGMPKEALGTPALLVDLDAMDANIACIHAACRAHGVLWRPHGKGQKVPELAQRQVAAGAIGVTCAKLGEAEAMADAGIRDILIANQVVGAAGIERLMALASRTDVIVAVDDASNLAAISAAARARSVRPRVVVEVDIGMRRAGVAPGENAVALAALAASDPAVRFAGFEAWEGHAAAIADPVEKRRAVAAAVEQLTGTAAMCRARGIPVSIVSCGGTATYPITVALPGVTEIQAGGGIFADVRCRDTLHLDLACALTVLTTVTSRPTPLRIVCDAGKKSMSNDLGQPEPIAVPKMRSMRLSAEHTILELVDASETPRIGERIEFVVGYGDTTVHLHDELYGIRDGRVESVWSIARGTSR